MIQTCPGCGTTTAASATACPSCQTALAAAPADGGFFTSSTGAGFAPTPAPTFAPVAPAPVADQFGLALGLSALIAVAGIAGWAIVAEAAHARTAYISFAVAAGMGAVMRRFAPRHPGAPVVVVALTAASALLGLLASQYALVADYAHIGFWDAVSDIPTDKISTLLTTGTTAITWIIMAASVVVGFRVASGLHVAARR